MGSIKNQKGILQKLGIQHLNPMQQETQHLIHSTNEVILLSPTGSGKTLAFLIPVVASLDILVAEIQTIIIAPSRELAIQIHQVTKEMGSGYKANVVYGGRHFSKDRVDLKHAPHILIGTPGRIADHIRRGTINIDHVSTIILDEFDKSLEIGFEDEMSEILESLPNVKKKILTSATFGCEIPDFVELNNPSIVDFLKTEEESKLELKAIVSPTKDKLNTLGEALHHLGDTSGIVFCNFKESIDRVSAFLKLKGIDHGCFYGGMEQHDRERALVKFRNGTYKVIIATDLASRGLDIPEIDFIIHYHLPVKSQEFIHRNGRTARMHAKGIAYVLHWEKEEMPDFIPSLEEVTLDQNISRPKSKWSTLLVSAGRRDKISKGDLAGLFFKVGQLDKSELGIIELTQDCAFVAVSTSKSKNLIEKLDNQRVKRRKVRIRLI